MYCITKRFNVHIDTAIEVLMHQYIQLNELHSVCNSRLFPV